MGWTLRETHSLLLFFLCCGGGREGGDGDDGGWGMGMRMETGGGRAGGRALVCGGLHWRGVVVGVRGG